MDCSDFKGPQIIDVPGDFDGFGAFNVRKLARSGGPVSLPKKRIKVAHPMMSHFGHYDTMMNGPIEDAIAKAKADIQKQIDAARAKAIADLQAKATTAAAGVVNKITAATTQTIAKGIDKAAASPTTAALAQSAGQAAGQATLSKADELKQKAKPYLIGAGALGAAFLLWKMVQVKKALTLF